MQEPVTVHTNLGNTTTTASFEYQDAIDLDELTPNAKQHLPEIMQFFDNVIKHSLKEKKYQQVGKLPKFFLASDKQEIR